MLQILPQRSAPLMVAKPHGLGGLKLQAMDHSGEEKSQSNASNVGGGDMGGKSACLWETSTGGG